MSWYKSGTVSLTNGSTAVVGTGTSWIAGAAVGEGFIGPDGKTYEIANIASDTSITLGTAYQGSTASGQSYQIIPSQSYIRDLASQAATLISDYGTVLENAGTGKFEDGSVSAPGIRFTNDENTGIRRPAADTLAIVVNGADKVTVSTSGVSGITKTDVGLANVDNTSDATKNAATATLTNKTINLASNTLVATSAQLAAALTDETGSGSVVFSASPALTGTPTAPTATAGTNTTQLATTAFVQTAVTNVIDAAPGALDTLNELAAALGDDANFAGTVTTALATKAPLASPALTGNVTVTTNSSSPALTITQDGTGNAMEVRDVTGDTTPFVVDSAGSVGIGINAPSSVGVASGIAASSSLAYSPTLFWQNTATDATAGYFIFVKQRNGTIVQSGDAVGNLLWQAYDGSAYKTTASIVSAVNGTPGTNNMPGRLVFSTTADGASSPTERMRIDSSGKVLVGSPSTAASTPIMSVAGDMAFNSLSTVPGRAATYTFGVADNSVVGGYKTAIKFVGASANGFKTDITFSNLASDLYNATLTERMRIDSSGNVGIGGTASTKLDVTGNIRATGYFIADNTRGMYFGLGDGSTAILGDSSTDYIALQTASAERMRIDSSGNVGIGGAAVDAKLDVIPGTLGNALRVRSSSSTSLGQIQFTDSGATTPWATIYSSSGSLSLNHSSITRLTVGDSEKFRVNSSSQALAMNSTGLGYGTGSGGTVTQATSKSTSVTLNKPSGQITMHNAALAAGASVSFTFNNSSIDSRDSVLLNSLWGAVDGTNYRVEVQMTGVGASVVRVTNISAGSLSDALVINFCVIKGTNS